MKTTLAVALALISLAPLSAPADTSYEIGREKAHPCTTCHGLDGLRQAPGLPAIGGRDYYELLADMASIRSGQRFHPIMTLLMQTLDEADMADVATYFASMDRSKLGSVGPYGVR